MSNEIKIATGKTRGQLVILRQRSTVRLNANLSALPTDADVDKHCGVLNEKGLPCCRSLTCKTHPMAAKRSVPGRSQSYDILLYEWNKATKPEAYNLAKNKKPVQPRVGPGSESYGVIIEGKKKKKRVVVPTEGEIVGEWDESEVGEEEEEMVDSEEEVEMVMRGLKHGRNGGPLAGPGTPGGGHEASLWTGRNVKLGRLRETLGGVFGTAGTR